MLELWELVRTGGSLALLTLIVIGGARGWWVYGWQYRELRGERDLYRTAVLRAVATAGKAVDLAARPAPAAAPGPFGGVFDPPNEAGER